MRYAIAGAVSGAPRTVELWTDGRSTKALGQDGRCWMWNASRMLIRGADGDTQRLTEGSGQVYTPPFPEARAIESIEHLHEWLDKPVSPSPQGHGTVLGRHVHHFEGEQLRVAVDAESGYVLRVSNVGLRGLMRLTVDRFDLLDRPPALFSCDGASL